MVRAGRRPAGEEAGGCQRNEEAWRKRLPFLRVADAVAPAAALGHGVGHIGCFFSGDSYGVPSNLPWAVAFPQGMPPSTAGNLRSIFGVDVPTSIPDSAVLAVHPTMLYSSATLLGLAAVLWWYRRRNFATGSVFGLYLVLAGAERFLVVFLRAKNDRFLGPLTTAQVVAVLLMTAGAALLWRLASGRRTTAEGARASEGRRRDGWAHESGSRLDRLAPAGQGRVSERP
jgi:phosphatidylglycerol---prolipoprotein diacylglyceryl transferase